jgi:uncharacterized protein
MADLAPLLTLQQLDTTLDQVRHRIAAHPLRAAIRRAEDERTVAAAALAEVEAERDELQRQQRRWDDEVAKVRARRGEIEGQLYGGTITSPKELVALQADADSLQRRQTELEDHELEVMEQIEQLEVGVAERRATFAALDEQLGALGDELTVATAELAVELDRLELRRAEAAGPVPAELLVRYEALRAELGGVAVARLVGSTCEGCHLTLSAMVVDQLRKLPPDAVAVCEDCGRILVR